MITLSIALLAHLQHEVVSEKNSLHNGIMNDTNCAYTC